MRALQSVTQFEETLNAYGTTGSNISSATLYLLGVEKNLFFSDNIVLIIQI